MARPKTQNPMLLTAALQGLEIQKERIEEQIREVRAMLGQRSGSNKNGDPAGYAGREKRTLSPEARKRISTAQRARWAKFRKTTPETEQ